MDINIFVKGQGGQAAAADVQLLVSALKDLHTQQQKAGGTVYSPHPPRRILIVGPHEGNKCRVIAYPDGSKPRIIILDGTRIQYETYDYGFSWKWEGVGDPPAGFLDIEQDKEAPAAPL